MIYWIWLQKALSQGNNKLNKILGKFSSAKEIYELGNEGRVASKIFNERELRMMTNTSLDSAKKIYDTCVRENISVITPMSPNYPTPLKNIPNPPLVLYVKGNLPDFENHPAICIVGSRKVSNYGRKCAYSLGGRLSRGGFTIVSGGAIGTDAAAHYGALLNDGITVAVLANGFGDDYLKQNEKLREAILENGCLITEYPPYTPLKKSSFHVRNRIMSGLSEGVIIVEASEKSGTLLTANAAIEQNRDLFVIPGNPGLPQYFGSNRLIRDGAKPLIELSDIFSEYETRLVDKIDIKKAKDKPLAKMEFFAADTLKKTESLKKSNHIEKNNQISKKILPEHLSKNAKIIYNQLDKQIFTPDDLLFVDLNSVDILSALGELELYGFISSVPGGRYTLK